MKKITDKMRLDWMIKKYAKIEITSSMGFGQTYWVEFPARSKAVETYPNPRQAIDSAMKSEVSNRIVQSGQGNGGEG